MSKEKLVNAEQLLRELFAEGSRPSMRWLRAKQKSREIPSVKIGRLIFFDVQEVRETLANRSLNPEPDQLNPPHQNPPTDNSQESQ